ncbi:MAG: hypothetical protein AAGC63_15005, partial [Propionicimonas sp.]
MINLETLLRADSRTWQAPPVAAPDLEAAISRSRERRSRLTAAAALVALVALAAGVSGVLAAGRVPAVPAATPAPSAPATAAPAPTGAAGTITDLPAGGGLSGSYRWRAASLVDGYRAITFTVPTGWEVAQGFVGTGLGEPGEVAVSFWTPLGAYADGCGWRDREVMRYIPGSTGWFAHFAREASDPVEVTLGGRPALRVELSSSPDLDPTACDDGEYRSWYDWSGRVDTNHAAGQTDVAYLVTLGDAPLVVNASFRPRSSQADRAALDAVLASL